ncbi:MAG TPA: response regulator [Elusimicrobiales bacterium]|nr:response regulator [Elusimicrobiales bacterium]
MKKLDVSVLVVDDNEDMLDLCLRILGGICDSVEGAGSSAAARAAFRSRKFDLLLTDINIDAGGDGVALASEIRTLSPSTRVIIMTADPTLETAIGGLKSGAMEYIVKPFSPEYLESVVRNTFERSRLFSELEREKALKAELETAYAQLKNSENVKDAFLARINHELRTPLAVALTSIELLGPELKGTRAEELWQRADGALKNLRLAIEELLLFSELLKERPELKKKPADLLALLEESARSLAFLYQDMGVSLSVSTEGEPYPVTADAALLTAAFKQLLANAVKFNARGGSVAVKAAYLPDKAVFRFTDTGRGVNDETMPKLFDGFFQAADYLTRNVGGIGLGLAIVKQIMEAHGGAVKAQRNPAGPGMVFTVSLPRGA